MKKALILIILFIVLIGGFFALKNKSAEKASADTLTEPWIVVESDTVTEIDANGTVLRTLVTGDEVVSGATVQTDTEGSAVLYFPDGSQARIDPNTTLTVTEATYESDTDSLVVRLSVSTGRVWSNVISFINSDSSWEVETAHAVATVRGTSFGTDADSEHTTFIGSESTVAIFALDPTTGKPVLETETTITTDDVIELRREDVEILISEKREIVKKKIEDLTQTRINEWIERQRENDGPLQKRFEELRAQDLSPEEVRATIRAEIQEAFTAEVEKRREELRKQLEEKEDVARETIADKVRDTLTEALPFDAIRTTITQHLSERNENELAEKVRNYSNEELLLLLKKYLGEDFLEAVGKPELLRERLQRFIDENTTPRTIEEAPTSDTQKVSGLILRTKTDLSQPVVEGTRVVLEAVLQFEDGTTVPATEKVTWSVVGPIGSMSSPGTFVPKLDPSVAEFGESSGAITAVWKDGLKAFLGKTPIFKVVPALPNATGELRG